MEPVLLQSDYHVPCHGVGETGPANRLLHGPFTKDDGKFSSRIAMIVKQAEKVPGPGKYVAHSDWAANGGKAFAKGERSYKPMNKTPAPATYERKDFNQFPNNACKDCLSTNPRVVFGKMSASKKRSFLDQAIRHGAQIPGPTEAGMKGGPCDRLDIAPKGAMNWNREMMKSESKKKSETDIAPNHYNPSFKQIEAGLPNYTVPKEVGKNFIDKAVKEKWIDVKSKKEIPGPGTYKHDVDLSKISRGTYHLQLRGLSRNALSGYF